MTEKGVKIGCISTPCPACGARTLFVNAAGYLTCGDAGCPEPMTEVAIEMLGRWGGHPAAGGFTSKGVDEGLKGGVHAFLAGVTAIVFAYNLAAWLARGGRHLAINAVAYGLATAAEVYQARRHFKGGNG